MANAFGRILARIWDDRDFLALEPGPQRLYLFLLSQSNLNHAGLLPLTLRKWAKKAAGLTPETIRRDLAALDAARFIVVDEDAEEVLIRTYVRNGEVWKQPRMMGAMVAGALEIESHRLRRALLVEMSRIPLHELSAEPSKLKNGGAGPSIRIQVSGHIENLCTAFTDLDPDPDEGPSETLPEPPPEEEFEGGAEGGHEPPSEGVYEGVVLPPAEGHPQDSSHAHAGPRARTSSLLIPLVAIAPPAGGGEPPRQQGHLTMIEGGASPAETSAPQTADQLVAYWIENVPKRPPGQVIARVGKSIKTMLAEGIDPADIAAGLEAWATRGKDPAVLPSIVNEVMNAGGADHVRGRGAAAGDDLGGDAHMSRYLARAAARRAREA